MMRQQEEHALALEQARDERARDLERERSLLEEQAGLIRGLTTERDEGEQELKLLREQVPALEQQVASQVVKLELEGAALKEELGNVRAAGVARATGLEEQVKLLEGQVEGLEGELFHSQEAARHQVQQLSEALGRKVCKGEAMRAFASWKHHTWQAKLDAMEHHGRQLAMEEHRRMKEQGTRRLALALKRWEWRSLLCTWRHWRGTVQHGAWMMAAEAKLKDTAACRLKSRALREWGSTTRLQRARRLQLVRVLHPCIRRSTRAAWQTWRQETSRRLQATGLVRRMLSRRVVQLLGGAFTSWRRSGVLELKTQARVRRMQRRCLRDALTSWSLTCLRRKACRAAFARALARKSKGLMANFLRRWRSELQTQKLRELQALHQETCLLKEELLKRDQEDARNREKRRRRSLEYQERQTVLSQTVAQREAAIDDMSGTAEDARAMLAAVEAGRAAAESRVVELEMQRTSLVEGLSRSAACKVDLTRAAFAAWKGMARSKARQRKVALKALLGQELRLKQRLWVRWGRAAQKGRSRSVLSRVLSRSVKADKANAFGKWLRAAHLAARRRSALCRCLQGRRAKQCSLGFNAWARYARRARCLQVVAEATARENQRKALAQAMVRWRSQFSACRSAMHLADCYSRGATRLGLSRHLSKWRDRARLGSNHQRASSAAARGSAKRALATWKRIAAASKKAAVEGLREALHYLALLPSRKEGPCDTVLAEVIDVVTGPAGVAAVAHAAPNAVHGLTRVHLVLSKVLPTHASSNHNLVPGTLANLAAKVQASGTALVGANGEALAVPIPGSLGMSSSSLGTRSLGMVGVLGALVVSRQSLHSRAGRGRALTLSDATALQPLVCEVGLVLSLALMQGSPHEDEEEQPTPPSGRKALASSVEKPPDEARGLGLPDEQEPPKPMPPSGRERTNTDFLDELVEACAAPVPYPVCEGVASLARHACRAAIRTFQLASAHLYTVDESQGEVNLVTWHEGPATEEIPQKAHLGSGMIGSTAARGAPTCWGTGSIASGLSELDPSIPGGSVVLCLPIMVRASELNDDTDEDGVHVLGVFRVARSRPGRFSGDDSRALSAFCGQIAVCLSAHYSWARHEQGLSEAFGTVAAREQATIERCKVACAGLAGLAVGPVMEALQDLTEQGGWSNALDPLSEYSSIRLATLLNCEGAYLLKVSGIGSSLQVERGAHGASGPSLLPPPHMLMEALSGSEATRMTGGKAADGPASCLVVPLQPPLVALRSPFYQHQQRPSAVICAVNKRGDGGAFDELDEAVAIAAAGCLTLALSTGADLLAMIQDHMEKARQLGQAAGPEDTDVRGMSISAPAPQDLESLDSEQGAEVRASAQPGKHERELLREKAKVERKLKDVSGKLSEARRELSKLKSSRLARSSCGCQCVGVEARDLARMRQVIEHLRKTKLELADEHTRSEALLARAATCSAAAAKLEEENSRLKRCQAIMTKGLRGLAELEVREARDLQHPCD
ncbi:unnamed protein product [Chrysoparadoxa australica]